MILIRTTYPSHGQTTVTYTVHYADSTTETIEFPLLIDPSGIVFNAATGDPIPGAKVTLFYSYSGSPGSFVEADPLIPPPGVPLPWIDPAVNPQITDSIGGYGWDVVPGYFWYVHVEKPGFIPKDSIVVFVPPEVTDLNVGLDPMPFLAPRHLKQQAIMTIPGHDKAIKHIQKSLADNLWEDGGHLTKKGKKVFDEEKKAVKELMKTENDPAAAHATTLLLDADRILAKIAIHDANAAGGDAKTIAKAEKELTKAQEDIGNGRYDKAIDHYRKSWENAQKAM